MTFRKLAVMRIFVAPATLMLLSQIAGIQRIGIALGIGQFRRMALGAVHVCMRTIQRESISGMLWNKNTALAFQPQLVCP